MTLPTDSATFRGASVAETAQLGIVTPGGSRACNVYAGVPPANVALYDPTGVVVRLYAEGKLGRYCAGVAALTAGRTSMLLRCVSVGVERWVVTVSDPRGGGYFDMVTLWGVAYDGDRGAALPGRTNAQSDVAAGTVAVHMGERLTQLDVVAGSNTQIRYHTPERVTTTTGVLPAGADFSWNPVDNEWIGESSIDILGDPQWWSGLVGGLV